MPQKIQVTVFAFDELSDEAKTHARDIYRVNSLDYPWFQTIYDEFEAICPLLGVTLRTASVPLMGGGSRQKANIYFRGFWSQGDGAYFEGTYRYRRDSASAIRAYAPFDKELHQIARTLAEIQRRNFYQLEANILHRGRYYHEYSMVIDVDRDRSDQGPSNDAEEVVKEGLRDLARWLYRRLEREYEHLTSDAVVDDALAAGDCRFRADGTLFV
ncbi:antitoxin of toxin-antitoxin stability system [Asticcacaulis sp.]|uniref:antitoxin of toxin-antitoxin stability system n=1 Tax=Asticcacaulis sp. TaxID=1872648 RepID=UPI003F7B8789